MNERHTPSTQSRSGLVTFSIVATWILLTLLTLPFTIFVWMSPTDCEGGWTGLAWGTGIDECKQQAAHESAIAGGLFAFWLVGSLVLLLIAGARRSRGPGRTIACPHCNLEVSVGVPTCLRCGYNLARV